MKSMKTIVQIVVTAFLFSPSVAFGQYRMPITAPSGASNQSFDDPDAGVPQQGPFLWSVYGGAYVDQKPGGGIKDWTCNSANFGWHWEYCGDQEKKMAITYDSHGGWDIIAGHGIHFAGNPPYWTNVPVVAPVDGVIEYAVSTECKKDNCGQGGNDGGNMDSPGCGGCGGGFGNHVYIRDVFGNRIALAHMRYNTIAVKKGDTVTCGQFIGYVGSSGSSATPHIHFQVNQTDTNGVKGKVEDPFAGDCRTSRDSLPVSEHNYLNHSTLWTVQPAYCSVEPGACYHNNNSCDVEPGARRHKPAANITKPLWYAANYGEDDKGTAADQNERKAFQYAYGYLNYLVDNGTEQAPSVWQSRLGCPYDAGGGKYVHDVYGVLIQNFMQANVALRFPGDGQSALVYNQTDKRAYLLHSGFYGAYTCMSDKALGHDFNGGSTILGAPTSNEVWRQIDDKCNEVATGPFVIVQHFQKGCMWWNGDGKVHMHPPPAAQDSGYDEISCGIAPNPPGPPNCNDGIKNGNEVDIDCGGSCPPCVMSACTNGQTASCGNCGTMSCSNNQWGSCQSQGVCMPGQMQQQGCGNGGVQMQTCTNSCQWGLWGACQGGCECAGGTCCSNGCNFDSAGATCGTCKVCNGSGSCGNAINGEACVGGTCQNGLCVNNCSYQTAKQNPDYTCGGGIVMNIQGSLDGAGNMAISATKLDGSTFGAGDYYVLVFDPNDGIPSNHCKNFNVQKGHIQIAPNSNPSSIVFPSFPSLLVCGGPAKGYCVSKYDSTKNDFAWFGSNELVATY